MNAHGKRLLILLGGMYHDFSGFLAVMQLFLANQGYQVEEAYNLDRLLQLHERQTDLVLSYTCLTQHREGLPDSAPEKFTDEQVDALSRWVRTGGGLLAAHSATVIGDSKPTLGKLLGGVFLSHPTPFTFTVYPLAGEHPITMGIPAFDVFDEFYIQKYEPDIEIHMVAVEHMVVYPMVWSKREGKGRVAHIAIGHYPEVWNFPVYRQLVVQALEWLSDVDHNFQGLASGSLNRLVST